MHKTDGGNSETRNRGETALGKGRAMQGSGDSIRKQVSNSV